VRISNALLIAISLLPSLVIASDPLCESANQNPLYNQLIPAVVSLGSNESAVGGSGVLIGPKHVLSSKHGNINIDRIYVRNVYNQVVHGRVIDSTEHFPDAAIIELDTAFDYYLTAPIATDSTAYGSSVFTVGHPKYLHAEGYGWGVTTGYKESFQSYRDAFGENYHGLDEHTKDTRQLFSLQVGDGNSGGPVFNSNGEVISIVAGGAQGVQIRSYQCGIFGHRYDSLKFYNPSVEVWTRDFNGVDQSLITSGSKLNYIIELVERNNIQLGGAKAGGAFNCKDDIVYDDENLKKLFKPLAQSIDPVTVWTGRTEFVDSGGETMDALFFPGGSGIFISPNLFLTVAHGLGDFDTVLLTDGRAFAGTTLYWDDKTDLALGIIDGRVENYHTKLYGENLKLGDAIAITGNPSIASYSLGGWLTSAGYITNFGAVGNKKEPRYITTAPTQSGNSGSPVYDQYGRIVGISSGGNSPQPSHLKVIDYDSRSNDGTHPLSLPYSARETIVSSTTSIVQFLHKAASDPSVKPYVVPTLDLILDSKPSDFRLQANSNNSAKIEYSTSSGSGFTNIALQLGLDSFFKDVTIAGEKVDLELNSAELPALTMLDSFPEFTPPGLFACESHNFVKAYCRENDIQDLESTVFFAQQISNASCTKGTSWGFDSQGLWVDKGCRAVFRNTNTQDEKYMRTKRQLNLFKDLGECKNNL